MPTTTIQLKDLGRAIEEFRNRKTSELRLATISGVARSIPMLVKKSPIDTGLYAQSWDMQVFEDVVTIGNTAPHAAIIEYGARPFTPPIKPLLQWAKRRLKDQSQPPNYSEAVRALAYGTQRKIAAIGIKPHYIMRDSVPDIIDNIRQELIR